MNVYVFKTSVTQNDIGLIDALLRSVIPVSIWNFDLDDCDRILRIESKTDITGLVRYHLQSNGFVCEELE
ncbi:MAG: hypothetical protein WBA74_18160 [Cyclobacteriaceae bacterium]